MLDHSFFFETGPYYAAQAGLKLAMYTRLASKLKHPLVLAF